MGFYGNITNTSKTQFQFDRIYPSRRVMEESMQGDGVFIGRYVLVEYDSDVTNVYKNKVYRDDQEYRDSGTMFFSDNFEESNRIRYIDSIDIENTQNVDVLQGVYNGTIVFVEEPNLSTTYYQCDGSTADGQFAHFIALDTNSNYVFNYSQDKAWAEEKGYNDIGRGWDSTVWQKVYANGLERYVMIAELNSVVPTFDISADAPSISPITPHFDANSTNVYYKLHWQPQWGVRIKSAYGDLKGPIVNKDGSVDNGLIDLRAQYYDQISYPSDATTEWSKQEYNASSDITQRYTFGINENSHSGSWISIDAGPITTADQNKINAGVPAAIYFNKDGLDSTNIVKSSDLFDTNRLEKFSYVSDFSRWPAKMKDTTKNTIKDDITLSPTGLSGHKYNVHSNSFDEKTNIDTYEFSLMLPSLGDTISDIWDLIYGGRDIPSIQVTNERNKDITWEDAAQGEIKSGLRLVHLRDGEFSYNPQEVETLAGCINTAHDIMGMIIQKANNGIDISGSTPQSQTDLNNLSINNIVYTGGAYYRKRKFYDYINKSDNPNATVAQLNARLYNFEKVNLIDFVSDGQIKYYEKVIPNYLKLTEIPEEGKTIYTLSIEPNKINYNPSDPNFDEDKGSFSDTYLPNKYYYTTDVVDPTDSGLELHNYTLETAPTQNSERFYVALRHYDENGNYAAIIDGQGNDIGQPLLHYYHFYKPGAYYFIPSEDIHPEDGASARPIPDEEDYTVEDFNDMLLERTYYCLTKKWEYDVNQGAWVDTDTYVKISSPNGNKSLVIFEQDKYYTFKENTNTFEVMTSLPNVADEIAYPCYTLPYKSKEIFFYQAGLYYYKPEGKDDYILDINVNYTPGRWYYELPNFNVLENVTFYESNKYYITDTDTAPTDNNAVIADGASTEQNKFYWKKADVYVANDPRNTYAVGMKWDLSVEDATNAGIVLCNRTERWGVEELKGFTDKINTMLGLILRIRAILDEGNYDTRDNQTVQGCINLMNDIIAKFGERAVGDVMITNNYGQIAGATISSSQAYQYINIKNSNNLIPQQAPSPVDNQWIIHEVNANYNNPTINFRHALVSENGHSVAQINSTLDLNTTGDDDISLYTPIIDAAGHVVGNNIETVTLPHGFKTIKVTNDTTTVADAASTILSAGQIADNTQDILTFAASNKWIKFDNNTEDTIKVGHAVNTISTSASALSLSSTAAETTFAVPNYTYDEAGHVTAKETITYTMPKGYGKFSDGTNTSEASATYDSFTISGDNWITSTVSTDTINLTHNDPSVTAARNVSNVTNLSFGGTFTIEDWSFDNKGHKANLSTHTVQIPQGSLTADSTTNNNLSNVVTGLSFTASSGAMNLTQQDVDTLKIKNYSLGTDAGALATSDTIDSALSKLQVNINTLNANSSTSGSVDYKIQQAINSLPDSGMPVLDYGIENSTYTLKCYVDSNGDCTYAWERDQE